MKRFFLGLLILLGAPSASWAQQSNNYCWSNTPPNWQPCSGNNPLPVIAGSYQFQSAGAGQYALAITSAQTLTVPAGSLIAEICVETASARYTTTGTTPSSTVGIPVSAGGCFQLAGIADLNAFKIIGAGATADIEYFK
jgi:hypothetical protein